MVRVLRRVCKPSDCTIHPSDCKFGTPEGTRTPDLLLRRQLLYPAELLAHVDGAGDGNRTRVSSLEGWCSTIELHPQVPTDSAIRFYHAQGRLSRPIFQNLGDFFINHIGNRAVNAGADIGEAVCDDAIRRAEGEICTFEHGQIVFCITDTH